VTDPETQVPPTAKQPFVSAIPFANVDVPPVTVSDPAEKFRAEAFASVLVPPPVTARDPVVSPKVESPLWNVEVASERSVEVEVVPKRASAKYKEVVAARVEAPVQ
jgi:hypothetical protein